MVVNPAVACHETASGAGHFGGRRTACVRRSASATDSRFAALLCRDARRAAWFDDGTLGSRVTTFGLADLRGGLSAGFDEGAWITTSYGVGQMLVGVASPYLGAVFGVRRVLLLGILLFFMTSLLGPFSPNLNAFLAMQFLGGIASGTFIPLTISYHRSQPAGAARRLCHRALCDEFRTVAERRGIARRVVFGPLVVAVDRLAILRDAAADVRVRLVRRTARAGEHGAAAQPRLAGACLCRDRIRAALCGARPGQPAGLEQSAVWSTGCCCLAGS